jgi:membrane protein YdbS with pleckstrin-like domain
MNRSKHDQASSRRSEIIEAIAMYAVVILGVLFGASVYFESQLWDIVSVICALSLVMILAIGSIIKQARREHWLAKVKRMFARIQQ